MVKSLDKFPKSSGNGFTPEQYQHDLRRDVAVESEYTGSFGLELELEGNNLPAAYRGKSVGSATWVAHADGSLRAVGGRGPGGMEYVLSQPANFESIQPLLDNLFGYIQSQDGVIQNSTRCSTHVHLNMKGFKVNQICSFVGLWSCFENILANWCGEHRSGNHFALRLCDSQFAVHLWEKALKTGNFQFPRDYRYLALNPACLNTFGSLEVRTMRGVDNSEEVIIWVEALKRLYELARSEQYSDPTMIALNVSGLGARGLFNEVFENTRIFETLERKTVDLGEDVDVLVRDGFRRIQPAIYCLPWQAVLPEISKPYIPDPFGNSKKKVKTNFGEPIFDENAFAPAPPPLRAGRNRIREGDRVTYVATEVRDRAFQNASVRIVGGDLCIVTWDNDGTNSNPMPIRHFELRND